MARARLLMRGQRRQLNYSNSGLALLLIYTKEIARAFISMRGHLYTKLEESSCI